MFDARMDRRNWKSALVGMIKPLGLASTPESDDTAVHPLAGMPGLKTNLAAVPPVMIRQRPRS